MDLSHRSMQPEEMDADSTSAEVYARCIRDLAGVNRITFTHRATLRWLARATRDVPAGGSVSILDVASGYGDLLRAIWRWADKHGLAVSLAGIDLNPRSAEAAAAATPPEMTIAYRTGDVFADDPQPRPDFIVSSQFAHHLTDEEVVRFIRWLDGHAARGWFIADLHRHFLAYYGFPVLARAFGWHRIVRQDGRISIARSFRRAEWTALLAAADVPADVSWIFPFRYGVGAMR